MKFMCFFGGEGGDLPILMFFGMLRNWNACSFKLRETVNDTRTWGASYWLTDQQTNQRTMQPTNQPSIQPTVHPTNYASNHPSNHPSIHPTNYMEEGPFWDAKLFSATQIPPILWNLRPPLWSSGQSFWLQIQRSRVRFPALPDFLSSSGSGTGSIQPREVNWGATWIKSSGSGLENRD